MGTVDRPLIRDVAALAAAAAVVGASFGAIAIAGGMPVWLASAMSMLVFAGGAQFMAVGVVAGGGSPVAAVLAGRAVGDPAALGVDAAFPAGLLALLLPTLRRPRVVERAGSPAAADVSSGQHGGTRLAERVVATVRGDRQVVTAPRRVALAGAVIALAATPVLPAGVPVLLALLGLVVALV